MINIVDAIKERREQRKKEKKEKYNYSKDMDRANCVHKRTKIFEIKPKWEIDAVSIVLECKGCTKIGLTDGTVDYYEDEVQWQDE